LIAAGNAGLQATAIARQDEQRKANNYESRLAQEKQATQAAAEIEAQRTLYAIEVMAREAMATADA
jgi:hypothetical protein